METAITALVYNFRQAARAYRPRGELIGINTAFLGAAKTNPGMGFAIPINMVRSIADQITKNSEARRSQLMF